MESLSLLGIFGIIYGVHGLLKPESGRVWGSSKRIQNNPEEAVEDSVKFNRIVNIVVILLSLFILIYPMVNSGA